MIDLEEFQDLKKKAERAKSEADRAEGALEQQMAKLKADFECDSVEQAEEVLSKLKREEKEIEADYEEKLVELRAKWPEAF